MAMTNWGNTVPWVALAIAVYGALLSTIQWLESRRERMRRLQVLLSFQAPISKGVRYDKGLFLRAVNRGYREVSVAAVGLLLPDRSHYHICTNPGEWPFPDSIPPGNNGWLLVTGQELVDVCDALASKGFEGTVPVAAFCLDAENRLHNSKPMDFNISETLRIATAQADAEKKAEKEAAPKK